MWNVREGSPRRRARLSAWAALLLGVMGCGDDPFFFNWESNPDTARLYALSRPELNLASAFDFRDRQALRLEAPHVGTSWDVAVDTDGLAFFWLLPGALGIESEAAMAPTEPGTVFVELSDAPEDTAAYVAQGRVALTQGAVYVVRTRKHSGTWGSVCNYYGKVQPLVARPETGVVEFQFDVSPICNSLELLPPS